MSLLVLVDSNKLCSSACSTKERVLAEVDSLILKTFLVVTYELYFSSTKVGACFQRT